MRTVHTVLAALFVLIAGNTSVAETADLASVLEKHEAQIANWRVPKGSDGYVTPSAVRSIKRDAAKALGLELFDAVDPEILIAVEHVRGLSRLTVSDLHGLELAVVRWARDMPPETEVYRERMDTKLSVLPVLPAERIAELVEKNKQALGSVGIKLLDIPPLRQEVVRHARRDTLAALLGAASPAAVRVFGIGEVHLGFGDVHTYFGARLLPRLQKRGYTHFAVELHSKYGADLRDALATGKVADVCRVLALAGTNGEEFYATLLLAAHEAGMRVVAVDKAGTGRDTHMAKYIGAILDDDKANRVVFWVGSAHLARGFNAKEGGSAADLLEHAYGKDAIVRVLGVTERFPESTVKQFTEGPGKGDGLRAACALPLNSMPRLRRLPLYRGSPLHYAAWDLMILYPGYADRKRD